MNILFVSDYYPPFIKGGAEVSTSLLVEWLAKKHEVHVVCSMVARQPWNHAGVDVYPIMNYASIGSRNFISALAYAFGIVFLPAISSIKLLRLIRTLKPDVVQVVPSSYKFIPIILAVRLCARLPVVIDCRDYSLICHMHLGNGEGFDDTKNTTHGYRCIKSGLHVTNKFLSIFITPFALYESIVFNFYKWALRIAIRHFNDLKLVANSQYVKNQLLINGYNPNAVSVIFNITPGVEADVENVRDPEKPTFVFAGRVNRDKGIWDIFAAAKILEDRGLTFLVEIVGDGEDVQEALETLKKSNLSSVKLIGKRTPAQVVEHYRNSVAIVAPSRWPEPFGRFIIEASAVGKPVITTRNGGSPEGIEEGVTGFLIDVGDSETLANILERLIVDPSRSSAMRAAILRNRERFSPEVIGPQRLRLYESLVRV